jgi:formate hydrogenlyase transcriptional activator
MHNILCIENEILRNQLDIFLNSGILACMNRIFPPPNISSDENYRIMTLASLFEGDFSIDSILELTGSRVSQILFVLEEGVRKGILGKDGPGIFSFRNLKEKQKLQDHLPPEKKEQLHRQIAYLVMRGLSDESKIQALIPHLLHISNNLEGCHWLLKGGNDYLTTFHTEEALKCFAKILEDLSDLSGEEADRLFIESAIKYSKISIASRDTERVISLLSKALERARRLSDKPSLSLLEMHLAKNEWLRSQPDSAMSHFETGWSIAKEVGDHKLLRSATTFGTFFLFWQGRYQEAVRSYEMFQPDIEKYPQGRFPLLAMMTVGRCYANIGQVTQGLGMLDAIHAQCLQRGDQYIASTASYIAAATLIDIRHTDDAYRYLGGSLKEADQGHNDLIKILGKLQLAFIYYLRGDYHQSTVYLQEYLLRSREVNVTAMAHPYLIELCWAMKQEILPSISGLSFEEELHQMKKSKNVFLEGIAYRYQAILQRQEGLTQEKMIQSLNLSVRCLEESGHQIELVKSELELSRQNLLNGDDEKVKESMEKASRILSFFDESLVPEDLRFLIKNSARSDNYLKEILKLSQEVVTIRDDKDRVQHIISVANRITGAERGAIFLIEDSTNPSKLRLRASKNLTSEQIADTCFSPSMKMIEEVSLTAKGRISETNLEKDSLSVSSKTIRSRICVPMISRDSVVGVLYHDNRLLSSAFRESDLELLTYFAALAAFSLENAKAYEEIQVLNKKLMEEKRYYEEQHLQSLFLEDFVGESPAIMRVEAQVNQVANTDTTVLILGETGVGKELVARAIHRKSARKDKPFIQVQCNVLPETLIASELFGHEKGAFTGAIQQQIGRFELADDGTLFLDELGDLPLDIQVRLLRVLENKQFERLGSSKSICSNFRLIAATNQDLQKAMRDHRFRQDLYYRLSVFPIHVPPLRERKEDIPLLSDYFLNIFATKMGKPFKKILEADMEKLIQYNWPGNVRELKNVFERGCILSHGDNFRLPELEMNTNPEPELIPIPLSLKENESRHILWALQKTGWKIRGSGGAAELLHIHPSTLAFRMKKLGIQRPSHAPKWRISHIVSKPII